MLGQGDRANCHVFCKNYSIELGGFGVLLDTLNTGPSLLLRGNNARSSFQCQDFIHDDMFQVLITPLKSISEIANHRN